MGPQLPAAGTSAEVPAAPAAAGSGATGMPAPTPPPPAAAAPSVFRITELQLRDPHLIVAGLDVTDTMVAGMSINRTVIPNQLTMDADRDGAYDLSTLLVVQPFDPRVPMGTLRILDGLCPTTGAPCTPGDSSLTADWTLVNTEQGACLTPLAGTTGEYRTPITVPRPPCFVTMSGQDLMLTLGGAALSVTQVKVSATYQAEPKQLTQGLLTGFVSDDAASRAILPRELGAPAGGMPIGNFVRSADKDTALSPSGQPGFFIYFNFVAKPVELSQ